MYMPKDGLVLLEGLSVAVLIHEVELISQDELIRRGLHGPTKRALSAPGRCAGRPGRPPECLNTRRFVGARPDLTCKLRVKMHVGCLGGKWAAGLMKRPLAALENIVRPAPKMLKKPRVSEPEGHSDL